MRTNRLPTVVWTLAALFSWIAPSARATTVTLTVTDPSNLARINNPVTSGVPISPGDTLPTVQWRLIGPSGEIPVQTKALYGIRNPWLLVDFVASVGANGSATYTLESVAPSVTASPALTIDESNPSKIIVVTGPLKVVIGLNPFNLFDEVWLDKNHNGAFSDSNEKLVQVTTNDNLPLTPAGTDSMRVGRRTPTSWRWEDKGPLRATLRVDGFYGAPSVPADTLLRYTTRLTFYAGQRFVTVDHTIRNSFYLSERFVKVKSAKLLVGSQTAPATKRVTRSGDQVWLYPSSGMGSLELIPDQFTYSSAYTGGRVNHTIDVDGNGGLILGDWSYHGGRVRFDFSDTTLTSTEQANRTTAFVDRLFALAPANWYSDRGAFASEDFGTYQDEKDANTAWGWAWPNPGPDNCAILNMPPCSDEHALPRPNTAYYPSWSTISATDDLESDDPWGHAMMYARTGQRTYLDRLDRWARYAAWEFAWRTDDFAFRDFGFCDSLLRARNDLPAGTFTQADQDYINFNMRRPLNDNVYSSGKTDGGHTWNGGLVDYYYLTGDRDALTAAIDLAEQSKYTMSCSNIDSLQGGAAMRFFARSYLNLLRAWEATGSNYWRLSANRVKAMFFHTPYYDNRGFYYTYTSQLPGTIPQRFPGGKYIASFQVAIAFQALYRDYLLTSDDSLKTRLLAMSAFAFDHGSNPDTTFTGDEIIVDWPSPGSVSHVGTNYFRYGLKPWYSSPTSSISLLDGLTIGYRLGGAERACYLLKAKDLWERASKFILCPDDPHNPVPVRFADVGHVGRWVNTKQCDDPQSILWRDSGDLTSVQAFFHDALSGAPDNTPPATVSDGGAGAGYSTAVYYWTAPGGDGMTGQAVEYDLRYALSSINEGNFLSASRISVPAPAPAGTPECVTINGLIPCATYYFAIKARDICGNWSAVSNSASARTNCSNRHLQVFCDFLRTESFPNPADLPMKVEFSLAGGNPTARGTTVLWGIPAAREGDQLEIAVFDLAGRKVSTVYSAPARAGRFRQEWDARGSSGELVHSGAYFVRMRLGNERRVTRVMLIR